MTTELTDYEVDKLLERFDETDPHLQRRIVAGLVSEVAALGHERKELQRRIDQCEALVQEWFKPEYEHGMIYGQELRAALR